jgi:16S rRNA (guanine527-N7)-methyltransferase
MIISGEEEAREFVATRCDLTDMTRLDKFVSSLKDENGRQNLVAPQSLQMAWVRHIADSAQLLDHVSRETSPWIDVGSGAGFPGIVLAIMAPNRQFILIESRNLRINWLKAMIDQLRLTNCTVMGSNVRATKPFKAAVISARAFAPLPKLLKLCAPFSTRDTEWVLPKGRSAGQELAAVPKSVKVMFHVEQSVTDATAGILVGRGAVEVAR